MGKGGGCVPSKNKRPAVNEDLPQHSTSHDAPISIDDGNNNNVDDDNNNNNNAITTTATATEIDATTATRVHATLKIMIVFYSMYGHVEGLARRMKKGIEGVEGVKGELCRVPETLPFDVLESMKAPTKDPEIPEITSPEELLDADGVLFGIPTRFGSMAAQMKSFFDSTGHLWKEQKLAGKPAGFFVSTGTQGGGQETTAWTAITQLAHHGMLFVPIGYTFGAGMFKMDSIRGGSPYGAGVYAGDGSREPTELELALAEHQGKYMATVVKRLAQA